MTNNEFIRGVLRTAPANYGIIQARIDSTNLIDVLTDDASCSREYLTRLDKVKKWMFYGTEIAGRTSYKARREARAMLMTSDEIDLIHAIIGIATESGELLEALLERIDSPNTRTFDRTNIAEEFGDVLWYLGLGIAALGESFEHLQEMNQKKLRTRFPEKFTEGAAINRDVSAERKLLESMTGTNDFSKTRDNA